VATHPSAVITSAKAFANNEVAYVAWQCSGKIVGCLGFEVIRVVLTKTGTVAKLPGGKLNRSPCAAWVAFKGQSNPDWLAQDTRVWPVQKFSWRDLTLRKRRNGATRRPDEVRVRYEIRPVGDLKPGLEPVPFQAPAQVLITKRDAAGKPLLDANQKPIKVLGPAYQGTPRPLAYLGPAVASNDVLITSKRPPFRSTFTNGILAAQWLSRVLMQDGEIGKNELLTKLQDPSDVHRKYLAGDVLPLLQALFKKPGSFKLALYELEDAELEQLITNNAARVQVILANTGEASGSWDARNEPARTRLQAALGPRLQNRMFNNSTHIGHNKFVVHLNKAGVPQAVFTGSTNWTYTGVAGQTNNALLIEDKAVAQAFTAYWQRLHDQDALPTPTPLLSSEMGATQQSKAFRGANETPSTVSLASGAQIQTWFSPNRPERRKPTGSKPAPVPPDLQEVYRRLRLAQHAVLFLAFYPGQSGVDNVIGEAVSAGLKDAKLLVAGAVSSPMAMPNYKRDEPAGSPTTFDTANVSIVRAAAIDEKTLLGDLGVEQLTARGGIGAIIHDKIVVIDPLSSNCSVILGSHNLGFKASYSNDENLVIVSGHQELAMAYAVHVLDVFDHYRFRAIANEQARLGKTAWSGYLSVSDRWQDGYVSGKKGVLSKYFSG
jgi:phosphatidylserine/phosphatidylglycerophosphate/cardiolipin synthase-like enzyme